MSCMEILAAVNDTDQEVSGKHHRVDRDDDDLTQPVEEGVCKVRECEDSKDEIPTIIPGKLWGFQADHV